MRGGGAGWGAHVRAPALASLHRHPNRLLLLPLPPFSHFQGALQLGHDDVDGARGVASAGLLRPPGVADAAGLDPRVEFHQLLQLLHRRSAPDLDRGIALVVALARQGGMYKPQAQTRTPTRSRWVACALLTSPPLLLLPLPLPLLLPSHPPPGSSRVRKEERNRRAWRPGPSCMGHAAGGRWGAALDRAALERLRAALGGPAARPPVTHRHCQFGLLRAQA